MVPPDWKCSIDTYPAGWECPSQPFWVSGWIASPSGLAPADVRAWLGNQPFLGVCGLARPDVDTAMGRPAGAPGAGFTFRLNPVLSARELRLEVCDQYGRWTEFFHHAVTSPAGDYTDDRLERSARPLLRLLEARNVRSTRTWPELARDTLAAESAIPLDTLPNPPFQGTLESPGTVVPVRDNHLLVTGWLAHREQRIQQLTAYLDPLTPQPLVHGLPREDVGSLFAGLIDGAKSRFAGYLTLPANLPFPLALRIFAVLEDGRRELVFAKRFKTVITSGAEPALPPYSRLTFVRAAWELWRAGWKRHWPADRPFGLRSVIRTAWTEYHAAAPRPLDPATIPVESPPVPTRPLHVTLVTHNLNLEGGPLVAYEFACHLAAQPGWKVRIVSPQDGPLRKLFEQAGLSIELLDVHPVLSVGTAHEFERGLDQLAAQLDWKDTDVIAANTIVAFWAVLVAKRLRKPAVMYLHESVSTRRYFTPHLAPQIIPKVDDAFTAAARVVFLAAASVRAQTHLIDRQNFRVLHGWIDVARIQAYIKAHPRELLRAQENLPEDAVVIANIGSISPRKGQHVFIEAVARLLQLHPAQPGEAPLVFLLMGAVPHPYLDVLHHMVSRLGLNNVRFIAQSPDSYRYFRLADIFVASSYEEAFPRVVMEAAVFGLPVVSTNVNGIPEMLTSDEAWLFPPGDPERMAEAMAAAIEAHRRGDRTRAERGHAAVCRRFDSAQLLPAHARLLAAAADQP
jgi:glycosyltransferase involved in cell wall biosynthesis